MTLVVAHRGAARAAPENTLEAFRLAAEQDADAIELDVHLTSDGELAVIHDETLERTTDGSGVVAALTMAEIRAADAGARFAAADGSASWAGRGLAVPTLAEVLAWLPARLGLVVEIKARDATDVVVAAVRADPVQADGRLSVISFDERAIERVRELAPEVPTGYLLVPGQPLEPALTWAVEHGHAGVHPWEADLGVDPARLVSMATAYGRRLGCYVVNDPERMQQLAALGLWGFVTDVPDVARAALPRA